VSEIRRNAEKEARNTSRRERLTDIRREFD